MLPDWSVPPLHVTPVPEEDVERGDGGYVCETIETFCRVSKDGFSTRGGDLVVLRPWQKRLLGELFARRSDGRLRHRTALIGMPRKNGKSALGSGLALDGLLFGGQGSDVYSCAGDKEQAKIVFTETKKMIAAEPELADVCKPMRDVIEVPSTNSVYRALSAEAFTKEGLNPSRTLFDEVHVQPNDELWEVMNQARAARLDPLLIGITTAGVKTQTDGQDTICYRLYKYGQSVAKGEIVDESFYMAWWGAPDGANYLDPIVWAAANPGFGDLVDPDDFAATVKISQENHFRTKRLNQWVSAQSAWLPGGSWTALEAAPRALTTDDEVVLGFDGSYNGDSTALIGCTTDGYIFVEAVWENTGQEDWHVDIEGVEQAVRDACRKYKVREIACDPYRWSRSMQKWDDERLPVVEFPQNASRMTPATTRFYEAVMNGGLSHDGNPDLARHLNNCVLKVDARGQRLSKESKNSHRRIDLAVAAVMAYERACQETPSPNVWSIGEVMAQLQADAAPTGPEAPRPSAGSYVRADGVKFTPF